MVWTPRHFQTTHWGGSTVWCAASEEGQCCHSTDTGDRETLRSAIGRTDQESERRMSDDAPAACSLGSYKNQFHLSFFFFFLWHCVYIPLPTLSMHMMATPTGEGTALKVCSSTQEVNLCKNQIRERTPYIGKTLPVNMLLPSSLYWPLRSTADRWMKTAWTNGFSWEAVSLLSSWQRMHVSDLGGGVWSSSETTPTAHRGGGVFAASWSVSLHSEFVSN